MVTIYENGDTNQDDETASSVKTAERIISDDEIDIHVNPDEKLSRFILPFIKELESTQEKKVKVDEQTIQVSEMLGKIARVYERIRTAVEYKGEHVLRRNAVERILKRLAWEQESLKSNIDTRLIADNLIKELIWARYLPNKQLPTSKIDEVKEVLDKYFYIIQNLNTIPDGRSIAEIRNWIFGVASSEIEDKLDPVEREIYVELMHAWFKNFFTWKDESITEHEKDIQIYLAIHRALTKSDEPIMRYHLILKEFQGWENAGKTEIDRFINIFPDLHKEIEYHLDHPTRIRLYRRVQKHTAAFEILKELSKKRKSDFEKILRDEQEFEKQIRLICREKYAEIQQKVNRGIVRSIFYIFATKVIFVLLIEVPYEIYKFGDIRYLPLGINILFPPVLMWIVGLTIGTPNERNTEMIIDRLKTVVYQQKIIEKNAFSLTDVKGRSGLVKVFTVIYTLLFAGIFLGIGYLLLKLEFTLFGIILFFVFLSLVLLFAFRIKFNANQVKVESEEEGFFGHLLGFLTLPFLNVGFVLSRGLSKLNVFTIILDFLIEAPLKSVIELSEEWTSYLREKRDKVIEMPD